jgi:hypothetical protein
VVEEDEPELVAVQSIFGDLGDDLPGLPLEARPA